MITGSILADLHPNTILGLEDLDNDLIGLVITELDTVRADVYGGDGTLGGTKAAFTYSAGTLTLTADADALTGDGDRLQAVPATGWTSVPFQDSGATTYYVGARANQIPYRITVNTSDSIPVYDRLETVIGEVDNPDSVTVTGAGTTLQLDITSMVAPGWTGAGTRPVRVWLVNPEEVDADLSDALFTGTAYHSGGNILIDVSSLLGQATPSTSILKYRVWVGGPTITTTDIRADPDYWIVGTVNTGVVSTTDQTLYTPWGTILGAFTAEHDATTGEHLNVTSAAAGVKVRTTAASSGDATSDPAIRVRDNTPTDLVELWADGAGRLHFPNTGATPAKITAYRSGADAQIELSNPSGGDLVQLKVQGDIDATAGIYATLDIETNASVVAGVNVEGAVDVEAGIDLGWKTTQARNIQIPLFATGVVTTGAEDRVIVSTPPKVRSNSGTAAVTLVQEITLPVGMSPGIQIAEITGYDVFLQLNAGTDSVQVDLRKATEKGAPATIKSTTWTGSGAGWVTQTATLGSPEVLADNTRYFFVIIITPTSATSDAEVSGIEVKFNKRYVS